MELPRLELPKFDGKFDEWLLFKDSFMSVIDNNAKLSAVKKFRYLCGLLTRDALKVIDSVTVSDINYKIAWDLLVERYDNKKMIVGNHIKELLQLPSITKDNYTSYRKFIDHVRTHLRALENLEQPVEHCDALLIHLVSEKLDFFTRREWENKINQQDNLPRLEELLSFLSNRARTLELMNASRKTSNEDTSKNVQSRKQDKTIVATVVNHTCELCNNSHFIYKCDTFLALPVSSRIEEVKKKQLCINCLGSGHYRSDCKASHCRKCDLAHNTLLHHENQRSNSGQQRNSYQNQDKSDKSSKTQHIITTNHSKTRRKKVQN